MRLPLLLAVLVMTNPILLVQAAQKGELWEQTTQMEMAMMPGFAMPATTSKMCIEAGMQAPPEDEEQQRQGCTTSNVKHIGNKMTWSMKCPDMSGHGEMVTSGDSFTGVTTINSEDGEMRIKMKGRKLGACDLATSKMVVDGKEMQSRSEMDKMIADSQKQSDAAMREMCATALKNMDANTAGAMNCSAEKTEICLRSKQSKYAYQAASYGSDEILSPLSKMCGTTNAAIKQTACAYAETSKDWNYLISNCSSQAALIAGKYCAGRDFTALIGSPYASFCSKYAGARMRQ